MIVVGLTGGVGSGKTTVANFFSELGIPVYISDIEAKKLMANSKVVIRQLKKLLGNEAYINGNLNKEYIANKIFSNKELLDKTNAIVHTKVAKHFKKWVIKQESQYCIKESAILFEKELNKHCRFTITVVAKEGERIKRVLKRDDTTEEKVLNIIKNQWKDSKKIALSDFVITNNRLSEAKNQVLEIHQKILKSIQ